MNIERVTQVVAHAIWILLGSISTISCTNDLKKLPKDTRIVDYTKDQADTVSIIISQGSWTKARIQAPTFLRNETAKPPYLEMPRGLSAAFYDDSMRVETTLIAKYGRYFPVTRNIIVQDSVVVTSKDGNKLYTNELVYNQATETFHSDVDVYIYGDKFIIFGDGFQSDRDFTHLSFRRQKGVIPIQKGTLP